MCSMYAVIYRNQGIVTKVGQKESASAGQSLEKPLSSLGEISQGPDATERSGE